MPKNNKNAADTDSNASQVFDIESDLDVTKVADTENEWKAKCEAAEKNYLYLRAEFDNFKRQSIKERSELIKYGSERLARDLIGVLDIFDQALHIEVTRSNFESFKKGVEMTAQQLRDALEKNGIQEIPSHGKPFDPNHNEALSAEPTVKVPHGHVSQVFRKAYKFHDKIIRPGQVVVAQKPTDKGEE